MNILHVVDMISQELAGGSAKVPFQLGEAQARLGHKVTIFTSDYQANNQIPPRNVTLRKFRCVLNLLGGIRLTPAMLLPSYKTFDVVHLHNYRTAVNIIAANQNVPSVLQAHGNAAPLCGRLSGTQNFIWRNTILRRAKAFIADAEMEIAHYIKEGVKREKIHIIPVGIDYREFANIPPRRRHDKKRVLFLGRFHTIKGADLLLEAFKQMARKDTTLVIAGVDYGQEAFLKQQISHLGIGEQVEWLGPVYDADKVREYTDADVYAMPSRYEMFGLTLLEALACGTPVIITDRCGIAPLLPPECGLVVPFAAVELAEAITKALDEDMVASYNDYRVEWAKQYDWANLAPRTIGVYKEVLND